MRTTDGVDAKTDGVDATGSDAEAIERPRKGASIEVEVESIAQGGDGFGRWNGMAVFLDRGLPGELVSARVVLSKRRHLRAVVTSVLRASERAEASACAVSERCGGCRFWRARYEDEVLWKTSAAVSSVTRIGAGVAWPTPAIVPAPSVEGYRTRARFRASPHGGSGFLESRSRHVIVSERCLVVHPAIDAARATGLAFFAGLAGLESVFFEWDAERFGVAVTGEFSTRSMTDALRIVRSRVSRHADRRLEDFTTVVVSAKGRHHETVGDGTVWRRRGGRVSGDTRVGGVVVRDPVRAFSQAYDQMNVELIDHVISAARAGAEANATVATGEDAARVPVVELFSGSGNLTFPLIEAGFDVDAIEGAPGPVAAAAAAWKAAQGDAPEDGAAGEARAKFHVGDLTDGLYGVTLERLNSAAVVVTDPPRGGMSPALVDQLTGAPAAHTIVYVSCDPPAMARDAALLARGGWRVERWSLLDMFPRTPHVEAVVVLVRTSPSDAPDSHALPQP